MSSTSSGSSSSFSRPVVTPTPENAILDQIAQYASSLAPQMLQWAQGAFAKTSQVTDQAVGNFFQASQQMTGLAGNMINQYNNLFAPENAQLVQDANSFASTPRMQTDMGMAGATQAQSNKQAADAAEQNLRSFGIDPSSGRYDALNKAAAVQGAANVAGSENLQRNADINTGQQLRAEAIQAGSQLPSSISNVQNTAIQANAGASNASLANANTGANLMDLANHYIQTAMGLKLSPVGQVSGSVSSQSSQSSQGEKSSNGNSSGGGAGGGVGGGTGGGGGGGGGMQNNTSASGSDGGFGGFEPNALIMNGGNTPGLNDPTFNPLMNGGFDGQGPIEENWWNSGSDPSAADQSAGTDQTDQLAGLDNTDWGSSFDQAAQPFDSFGGGSDAFSQDFSSTDSGGGASTDDFSSSDDGFALGGAMPDEGMQTSPPTTGGGVPPGASPSGGAQTDDVNAHLNAGEFVVPKDVAAWKGQEFFHKLIAQSRTTRNKLQAQNPVGPQRQPARPGPANFVSQRAA